MDRNCAGVCGDNVVGQIGDNLIETVADVAKMEECWKICKDTQDCLYFTHFNADNTLYPSLCLLLKELNGPFKTCTNCSTGVVDCSSNQLSVCGLLEEDRDGNQVERKQLFTSTVKTASLRQVRVGHCRPADLTIVAIGGGGSGPHVDKCEPGNSGSGLDGGNGYSGGGSSRGDGGSNGSDGEFQNRCGGIGSGVDLTQLPVDLFLLTPGKEGRDYEYRGGGGGGILIDGGRPDGSDRFWGSGEGYGGGAGGWSSLGLPGAVLIEYKELPAPGAPTTTTSTTTTSTTSTATSITTSTTTASTTITTTPQTTTTTTTPQPSTVQSGGNCKTNVHSILLVFSLIALMF